MLYTTWGSYITPSAMGLTASAAPIVWVATGGRKDLTATLLATIALIWVSQMLAVYGSQYALILQGVVLVVAVLLSPEGFIVSLARRIGGRRVASARPALAAVAGEVKRAADV